MTIDKKETLRYLGYGKSQPDSRTDALVEQCIELVQKAAVPRITELRLPLAIDGERVNIGILETESKSLVRNLSGCTEAVLLAATLGAEIDRLMHREALLEISHAAVLQAATTAAIEAVCDDFQQELKKRVAAEGLFLRPRLSPGYGDFDISCQRSLLQMLGAQKIGLTLTDGMMLAPTKSVTAVIGLSGQNLRCPACGCEICGKSDCIYRRN